jgi:predicted alpha/beta hydrolase
MEDSYPRAERAPILARFAALRAPILAVGLSDDDYAPPRAIARGLSYYRGAERRQVRLEPAHLGHDAVGHFALFHSRHAEDFWPATCAWLAEGVNPWPHAAVAPAAD